MNQVAVITGGSRGIGRGIALALADAGFDLVITYHSNTEAAKKTAADCLDARKRKNRVEICRGDVAEKCDREELIDFTAVKFGRVDLLVNNAGIAPKVRTDLLDTNEESFDELLETNCKGPFFLTQSIAKWMLELKKKLGDNYRPKIVTISSISAYTASINRGEYCISKAALSMLTPLFAARLAAEGINVFEIRPGIILTDMTSSMKEKYDALIDKGLTPIGRWGTPEDVGNAVAAIAEDRFPFSTGEVFNVDGGFHFRRL